jgi:hypothetical protein
MPCFCLKRVWFCSHYHEFDYFFLRILRFISNNTVCSFNKYESNNSQWQRVAVKEYCDSLCRTMHVLFGNRPKIKRLMFPEPLLGQGFLIVECSRSHSIGLLWTSDQREAETSNWQHTKLTKDFPTPSGVRTRDPSKQAAADPCLKTRGHWDHEVWSQNINLS